MSQKKARHSCQALLYLKSKTFLLFIYRSYKLRGARGRKRKNLIRLGVSYKDAFRWGRSRLGGWAIAQSPILNNTITVDRLIKRGYEPLIIWYKKVAPKKFTQRLFPIV
jgi:hypothetical protein